MLDVARPMDITNGASAGRNMSHASMTQARDSTIRRGHTISAVTAEAGAVFEHLLRRSYSDSSSSNSRRGHRSVSRRPLTVITETSYMSGGGAHPDESTDNWTADTTRDSIDMRLSSYNGLDDIDGRPSHSSVQSRDRSRDTIDVFESSGTRLSSTDELDDAKLSSRQPNRQFSHDSADLIASSGVSDRHTTEAQSLGSMSVELADVSEADDEQKRKAKTPKKKKSMFHRVRERLRATFSRNDRSKVSRRAEKYMHANGKASRENWITTSFRRRKKKHHADNGQQNESVSAADHPVTIVDTQSHHRVDRRQTYRDQPKSKGLLSSLRRTFSSIHDKRSQSRGSVSSGTQLSQSGDELNLHPLSESQERILSRYATADGGVEPVSMHSRQGHHSMRARLGLDIVHPMRPAAAADTEPVIVDVDEALSSDLDERVRGWDFIDGGVLSTVADGGVLSTVGDGAERPQPPLQHATSRTFSEKSPAEKEELYERIASQLISIGDRYANSTPPYATESNECAASLSTADATGTLAMDVDLSAVASQMLSTATHSYSTFQNVVNEAIRGESALQQIAFVFELSRAAIEHAGTGTELAVGIKNMTMRYFEQYFAPWIVQQGGWESVVESVDSELD